MKMAETKFYVFFDFEMLCSDQGMPYSEMEAIRLGAVKYNLESETLSYFDRFIKPINTNPLSNFCKKLTGIRDEQLMQADSFPVVFEEFLSWVGGVKRTQFFSWSKSDLTRLILDAGNHDLPETTIRKIEERYIDLQAVFAKRVSKTTVSVENALALYGLSFNGQPHHPMYDALNTFRIYSSFANLPIQSELIMVKQFIIESDDLNASTINDLVNIEIKKDMELLSSQLKEIYRLKDYVKLLKKMRAFVLKYQNIITNRSRVFSKETIESVRFFVQLYDNSLEMYHDHLVHSSKIIIVDEHTLNDLRKLSIAI
jgi:inhibitor of KinA sporulation pathway (predicted exonuclease)